MFPTNSNDNQDPYGFILERRQPTKLPLSFPSGGSKKSRILIVALGILLLLFAYMTVTYFLNKGSSAQKVKLIDLVATQNEIARISAIGVDKARSQTVKNLAVTTKLSTNSAQNDLVAALKKHGIKVGTKELSQKKDTKIDKALDSAIANNNFDDIFNQTINKMLADYQKQAKNAFDSSNSKSEKQLLNTDYSQVATILGKTN